MKNGQCGLMGFVFEDRKREREILQIDELVIDNLNDQSLKN